MNFKDKKTVTLLSIVAILAVLTIGAVAFLLMLPDNKVIVQDFTTKSVEEVEQWAEENKLEDTQVIIKYEYSDDVDEDKLVSQSIKAEEELDKNTQLILVFSKGADPEGTVLLPDFKGMDQHEIEEFVKKNKLSDVTYEYAADETVEKDRFIKINVTENTVKRNTMLIITISLGRDGSAEQIIVPDFKDYNKAKITNWGKANKIKITFKEVSSDQFAKGKVMEQSIKAGETIKTGDKITITLSKGKAIEMKKLAGMSKTEALDWIKKAGLKSEVSEEYHGSVAEGKVISSTPEKGDVAEGTTVKIKVSLGYPDVPNFVGKAKEEVPDFFKKVNAKNANLTYELVAVESSEPIGKIVEQTSNSKDGKGNAVSYGKIKPGSKITLKYSKGKSITLSSFAGKTEDEFKKEIGKLKLNPGSRKEVYHDTYGNGLITENQQGNFAEGMSVWYKVSIGKYAPDAESFNNKTVEEVNSILAAANNKEANWKFVKGNEVSSDTVAKGQTTGCRVDKKTLTCDISKGPLVTVPEYTGKESPCQIEGCKIDNLSITQKYVYSSSVAQGTVISQSVAAGEKVEPGKMIVLEISKGPEPTPTPKPDPTPDPTPEVVKATVPDMDAIRLCNAPESVVTVKNNLTALFNGAGFANVTFVEVKDPTEGKNGIFKGMNVEAGAQIDASTAIVIEIFAGI